MIYTELAAAIKGYLETDFPDTTGPFTSEAQINTFIRNAEQRIYNAVNLPASQFYSVKTIPDVSTRYFVSLPVGTLSVNSITAQPSDGSADPVNLLPKDYSFLSTVFNLNSTTSPTAAAPKYYAYYNATTIFVAPYPNTGSNYTLEIAYEAYPQSIVDATGGITWLGANFDLALLYGALVEGATFIQAEQDIFSIYNGRFQETLQQLKQLAENKDRSDWYRNSITSSSLPSAPIQQRGGPPG